jgi:hypothetical protein
VQWKALGFAEGQEHCVLEQKPSAPVLRTLASEDDSTMWIRPFGLVGPSSENSLARPTLVGLESSAKLVNPASLMPAEVQALWNIVRVAKFEAAVQSPGPNTHESRTLSDAWAEA